MVTTICNELSSTPAATDEIRFSFLDSAVAQDDEAALPFIEEEDARGRDE